MPLVKSGSPKAFTENVKRELGAGRPRKQALAIAFSVKRKAAGRPPHERVIDAHHRAHGYKIPNY